MPLPDDFPFRLVFDVRRRLYIRKPTDAPLEVSREEMDACRAVIQERHGYVLVDDLKRPLFHGVSLILARDPFAAMFKRKPGPDGTTPC